jgi:hypothetical protein
MIDHIFLENILLQFLGKLDIGNDHLYYQMINKILFRQETINHWAHSGELQKYFEANDL